MAKLASADYTKQKISELLDQLPEESLAAVKQFAEFLHEQSRRSHLVVSASGHESPAYVYPTVAVPVSSLRAWMDLLPGGCGGDALADTEALYDEV